MAGKKLLVADDSLTIQKVIRLALSNEGYEIQAVSDGNDAIQQISLFRPDAVLIDVSLPGKTAFEVKRAINEHADLEEVRFILMSSAFEKVDEPQAAEVRFHGRLTKPFDPAHLRQVLTDTLAQVVAKRLEPTSLLQRPAAMAAPAQQPAQPTQTAQPARPAQPAQPAKPTQAPAPMQPAQPARPAAPAQPASAPRLTPAPAAPQAAAPPPTAAPAAPPLPPMPVEFSAPSSHDDIEIDFSVTPPHPSDDPVITDDWTHPVQSNEPIVAPPPALEDVHQLWDQEPTLSTDVALRLQQPQSASPPAQRTPPPPASPVSMEAAPHGSDPDADIRHLTESTIRMSGLDDFEWSVNEPSLKPPSQLLETGEASFQLEPTHEIASDVPPFKPDFVPEIANVHTASDAIEVESPSLTGIPAPAAQVESAASPSDFYRDPGDVTKRLTRPAPSAPPQPPSAPRAAAQPAAGASHAAEASVVGISSDQIEELLRKELQKLLPELAEKIIKQEIHRMLSATEGTSP